jgi:hypothetical protein
VVSAELIDDNKDYQVEQPKITLSEPFIVNNKSNPDLISDYLLKQACLACNIYRFENHQIENPIILLKYKEINLDSF